MSSNTSHNSCTHFLALLGPVGIKPSKTGHTLHRTHICIEAICFIGFHGADGMLWTPNEDSGQLYLDPSSSTERVRIITELQDKSVTAGEDAVFVCELSHADVSEGAEWWLCSSPLQKNEMNQMSVDGRHHRLVLTMTTPEETGEVMFVIGEERTSAQLLVVPRVKGKSKSMALF